MYMPHEEFLCFIQVQIRSFQTRRIDSMFFSLQGTTSEYKVEVKDGKKEVNETIKIDTGKKTETVHISSGGRGAGKVDVLFDFKQVSNWEGLSDYEPPFFFPSFLLFLQFDLLFIFPFFLSDCH